jgi:hypothetical protein
LSSVFNPPLTTATLPDALSRRTPVTSASFSASPSSTSPFSRSRAPIFTVRSSCFSPINTWAVKVSGASVDARAAKGATSTSSALVTTKNTCALICGIAQGLLLGQLRAQARELGAVGGDGGLLKGGVDFQQEIALFHRLAHLHLDLLHLPGNLRAHIDIAMRLQHAQGAHPST